MSKLNLMMHCGGRDVTREDVDDVDTPKPIDGWYPVPHDRLLDSVAGSLENTGLRVVDEAHGLAKQGQQYFGMLHVANGHDEDDYGLVVGIRNSHDKTFAASLALGAGVFVCDNLSFSGEVKLARKHTRFIERDLNHLVGRAVGLLGDHRKHQDLRIAAYKQQEIDNKTAHDFIVQAIDARVIGPTKVPQVLADWRKPAHEEYAPRTAWSLFNAFTQNVLKGNAGNYLKRTQTLHGMMDCVCQLAG